MENKRLKIGILGLGHLGKIHLKCILLLPETYELLGFYDTNPKRAEEIEAEFGIKAYANPEALIEAVDIIDIVTPTSTHFQLAKLAIEANKAFFIEKPLTSTLEEAQQLFLMAQETGVKAQVGFVERFNPAFLAIQDRKVNPMFIEAHRLSAYNPRGTDVSVVLDLMIHDLDILLTLVDAKVVDIKASGLAIVSPTADIANARIEFDNNAVANITASRISMKNMRKFRLFQSDAYISLDFLEKKTEIIRIHQEKSEEQEMMELDSLNGKRYLELEIPESPPVNAIKTELELFAKSVLHDQAPTVPLLAGVKALELAYQIMEAMEKDLKQKTASLNL
jgi:predicted dehydrogenase